MTGIPCPRCGRDTDWAATHNEWQFVCKPCDARFNRDGDRMPPFETIIRFYPNGTDVVAAGCGVVVKYGSGTPVK